MLLIHKGLQDKLIATGGYCIMNTDEGTGFLDDMTKKEVKHESDISLIIIIIIIIIVYSNRKKTS